MQGYFQNFPIIPYNLTGDPTNNPSYFRNIFLKLKIRDSIKNKSIIYYPYYVKDGETPEIIASKYYKDITKHWLVMMANDIIDPQFDWPLEYGTFISYIRQKYSVTRTINTLQYSYFFLGINELAVTPIGTTTYIDRQNILIDGLEYAQETIHHYEKKISRTDSSTGITTDTIIQIDENTYNNTPQATYENFNVNGIGISVVTTTNYISIFDYELLVNEEKRNINLISKDYLGQIENEFMKLVKN